MSALPTITAAICVHDGEAYLAEAIESVLEQTLAPLEALVIDDGSHDRSASIAARYAPRVTLLRQPHGRLGAARNHALRVARGEAVAFLDADDVWAPEKLALQARALAEHPEAAGVGGLLANFVSPELDVAAFDDLAVPWTLVTGRTMSVLLLRRSAFARVGRFPTDTLVGSDQDWFMRFVDAGLTLVDVPELLLWRRVHHGNQNLRQQASQAQRLMLLKRGLERRRAGVGVGGGGGGSGGSGAEAVTDG